MVVFYGVEGMWNGVGAFVVATAAGLDGGGSCQLGDGCFLVSKGTVMLHYEVESGF